MNTYLYKYLLVCSMIVACVSIVNAWPDENLHIIFCDVGQGDAILVTYHFTQLLIDAGRDNAVLHCLSENTPFWDNTLEYIIATHPDADHIGGFESVLAAYAVGEVITNGEYKNTADFEAFTAAVSRKKGAEYIPVVVGEGDILTVGRSLSFVVLSPRVDAREKHISNALQAETLLWDEDSENRTPLESSNNRSIALFMTYKEVTALLTGDLEEDAELALLSKGLIPEVDVLKVGHHGAKTSTTEFFLSRVRPEISVLSVGKNNTYKHPAPEVIERLERFGTMIYRTDEQGTLHFVSDGTYIWLF